MKKIASNILGDIAVVADALEARGQIEDAKSLRTKLAAFKTAETHLYRATDFDGDDWINFAHRDTVKLFDSEHSVIENGLQTQDKILKAVNLKKKAELVQKTSRALEASLTRLAQVIEESEEQDFLSTQIKQKATKVETDIVNFLNALEPLRPPAGGTTFNITSGDVFQPTRPFVFQKFIESGLSEEQVRRYVQLYNVFVGPTQDYSVIDPERVATHISKLSADTLQQYPQWLSSLNPALLSYVSGSQPSNEKNEAYENSEDKSHHIVKDNENSIFKFNSSTNSFDVDKTKIGTFAAAITQALQAELAKLDYSGKIEAVQNYIKSTLDQTVNPIQKIRESGAQVIGLIKNSQTSEDLKEAVGTGDIFSWAALLSTMQKTISTYQQMILGFFPETKVDYTKQLNFAVKLYNDLVSYIQNSIFRGEQIITKSTASKITGRTLAMFKELSTVNATPEEKTNYESARQNTAQLDAILKQYEKPGTPFVELQKAIVNFYQVNSYEELVGKLTEFRNSVEAELRKKSPNLADDGVVKEAQFQSAPGAKPTATKPATVPGVKPGVRPTNPGVVKHDRKLQTIDADEKVAVTNMQELLKIMAQDVKDTTVKATLTSTGKDGVNGADGAWLGYTERALLAAQKLIDEQEKSSGKKIGKLTTKQMGGLPDARRVATENSVILKNYLIATGAGTNTLDEVPETINESSDPAEPGPVRLSDRDLGSTKSLIDWLTKHGYIAQQRLGATDFNPGEPAVSWSALRILNAFVKRAVYKIKNAGDNEKLARYAKYYYDQLVKIGRQVYDVGQSINAQPSTLIPLTKLYSSVEQLQIDPATRRNFAPQSGAPWARVGPAKNNTPGQHGDSVNPVQPGFGGGPGQESQESFSREAWMKPPIAPQIHLGSPYWYDLMGMPTRIIDVDQFLTQSPRIMAPNFIRGAGSEDLLSQQVEYARSPMASNKRIQQGQDGNFYVQNRQAWHPLATDPEFIQWNTGRQKMPLVQYQKFLAKLSGNMQGVYDRWEQVAKPSMNEMSRVQRDLDRWTSAISFQHNKATSDLRGS